jgi:AcrR family transcriptional regulator
VRFVPFVVITCLAPFVVTFDAAASPGVLTNWLVKKKRTAGDSGAAILRAAATEFAERGYDAARVDRIAARARVNKAMLYYHHGSKQGLYLAILREIFTAVGARARTIADGPGTASEKIDTWIATVVAEAAARPWFPPIMLRELASGGAHVDPETLAMMNAIYAAVRKVIVQGQQEGAFGDVDPLLTHMTIMPAILIFFARQRVATTTRTTTGVAAPREIHAFVQHMQQSVRRMLRKEHP